VRGLAAGVGHLGWGFGTWRTRPRLMLLGMVPALLVFLVLAAAVVALLLGIGDVVAWATPFADDWATALRAVVRFLLAVALLLAVLLVASSVFVALTLVVGDPFYERMWLRTEQALGGPAPGEGPGFWESVRDGGVLAAVGVGASLLVLVAGFVPVVGPVVGVVLGVLLSGRLLAAELLSRPLGARGLDRAQQARLLRRHRGRVLGFGVATQLCFLVPVGGVVAMPAAVVGSTRLARDLLAAPPGGR